MSLAPIHHEGDAYENPLPKCDSSGSAQVTYAQAAVALIELSKGMPSKKRKKEWAYKISSKTSSGVGDSTNKSASKSQTAAEVESKKTTSSKKIGTFSLKIFKSEKHENRWPIVLRRNLVKEHYLRPFFVSDYKIIELLEELGLSKTALAIESFVKKVVLEILC